MVNAKKNTVTQKTLWGMVWRSFFLQACWNFQRMQNVGFAFTLIPLIKKLQPTRAGQIAMVKRHLEFFNTHPYCASIIFGVVAHFEEKTQIWQPSLSGQATRLKGGMMGPLAALGDTVYWATLKPALALLGVVWVLLSPVGQVWPALLGPILFLAVYSVFHLLLRIGGIMVGYQRGIEVIKDLRNFNPQLIARQIGIFISIILGAGIGGYYVQHAEGFIPGYHLGWVILPVLLFGLFVCLRRRISATVLFYLLVGLAMLGGWLRWI